MGESLDVQLNGEPVQLLADRALYWRARRRLRPYQLRSFMG